MLITLLLLTNLLFNPMNDSVDLLKDSKFKSFIENFTEHVKSISLFPLDEQRKLDAQFILRQTFCTETVFRIENLHIIADDDYSIPLRIYIPSESTNLPVMMYFHSGGWVYGSIEESDAVCRRFCNHLNCIVVSVGYRLSPEFPFPKPLEDCYTTTQWVAERAHEFGGDAKNIIVSGESAGGNLAAAVAIMARDRKGPCISSQLLLYPVIKSEINDYKYDNSVDHHFITKDVMRFFWSMYIPCSSERNHPLASLTSGKDFSALPPALFVTAEYDPLSLDAEEYAKKLSQANVKVIQKCFNGLIHGFLYIPLYDEDQKIKWTQEICQALNALKN